jgi:hypothetical protein
VRQETLSIFAGLAVIKLLLVVIAVTVFLAGCAPTPTPDKLVGPPKSLMSAPKPFPTMKDGDDAVAKLAEAAEAHNRNARKIRGLQGYIKTVRKE